MENLESLTLEFDCSIDSLEPIHRLEEELRSTLNSNVGYLDGHEICIDCTHGILYLFGKDASKILDEIKTSLKNASFLTFKYGNIRQLNTEGESKRFKLTL